MCVKKRIVALVHWKCVDICSFAPGSRIYFFEIRRTAESWRYVATWMQRIEFRESAQDPMAIPTSLGYLGHFSQKLEVEDRDLQQQKNNTQKCDVQLLPPKYIQYTEIPDWVKSQNLDWLSREGCQQSSAPYKVGCINYENSLQCFTNAEGTSFGFEFSHVWFVISSNDWSWNWSIQIVQHFCLSPKCCVLLMSRRWDFRKWTEALLQRDWLSSSLAQSLVLTCVACKIQKLL